MANTTGKKWGGRTRGTPNKQTSEIREAYRMLIENNLDNLAYWIETIAENSPEKAIDILIKLSEYVVPKLNRTRIESFPIGYAMPLSSEEREKRIKELIKKYQDDES